MTEITVVVEVEVEVTAMADTAIMDTAIVDTAIVDTAILDAAIVDTAVMVRWWRQRLPKPSLTTRGSEEYLMLLMHSL